MQTGDAIQVGDRVRVKLGSPAWRRAGWFDGAVVRIDPYSEHRSFFWVELDEPAQVAGGGETQLVSVLNPRNIQRIQSGGISKP
jgi:hypothetical protein